MIHWKQDFATLFFPANHFIADKTQNIWFSAGWGSVTPQPSWHHWCVAWAVAAKFPQLLFPKGLLTFKHFDPLIQDLKADPPNQGAWDGFFMDTYGLWQSDASNRTDETWLASFLVLLGGEALVPAWRFTQAQKALQKHRL